jgi:hypothetical protein
MIQTIRDALDSSLREYITSQDRPRAWGDPINEDEWDELLREGSINAIAQDRRTIEKVRDDLLAARQRHNPHARAARQPGPSPERIDNRNRRIRRERAMQQLLALDAEQDAKDPCGLHAFRRDVLRDRTVSDVEAWLNGQRGDAKRSGPKFSLVPVAVDGTIHRVAYPGSVLERLGAVGASLADRYGWDRAEAATFVLTRTAPSAPAVKAEVHRKLQFPALSKIILSIDLSTTPSEVAAIYGRLRAREFGQSRLRRLDEKHTELAVFAYAHRHQPIAEQLIEWNQRHKRRWWYRFPAVFKREAELAMGSLLELRPHRRH